MTTSRLDTDSLRYLTDLSSLLDPDLDPQWQMPTGPFILPPSGNTAASLTSAITFAAAGITGGIPIVEDVALASEITNGTAAKALAVNLAVADYTVPDTGAILTGAGIKIGILSDSFNLHGGEASAIAAGDLPAASDITILQEGTADQDEGMAMAEIVHSIAPGAQIYFYTATTSEQDFADGITALANAGCTILVDDVVYTAEPFYQTTGPVDAAVEAAISKGVSYFSAAGNASNNFYEAVFNPIVVNLGGTIGAVTAHNVGTYEMVFYENAGTQTPGTFKIVMFAGSGATIDGIGGGIGSGTSIGQQIAPGVNTVAAINYANTPAYGVTTPLVDSYSGYGPGETYLSSTGSLLAIPVSHDGPQFAATDGSATTTTLDPFYGTSAAAPAAAAAIAELALSGAISGLVLADDTTTGGTVILACYAAGTGIATPAGDVAVEHLGIGQTVVTASGAIAPIVWIGHRHIDCLDHPNPELVLPVRIRSHAFGRHRPYRDLLLSPEHAIFTEGVLIPANALVDGIAIDRIDTDAIT